MASKTRKKTTAKKKTVKSTVAKKAKPTTKKSKSTFSIATRRQFGTPAHICREHDYATDPRDTIESQARGFELHQRRSHPDRQRPVKKKAVATIPMVATGTRTTLEKPKMPDRKVFEKMLHGWAAKASNKHVNHAVKNTIMECISDVQRTLNLGRKVRQA